MQEKYLINNSKEIILEIEAAKIKVAVSVENLPIEGKALAKEKLTAILQSIIKNEELV